MKEKEELLKLIAVLEKETTQLREQVGRVERELNHEKERGDQLQAEQKVSCVLCNWLELYCLKSSFFRNWTNENEWRSHVKKYIWIDICTRIGQILSTFCHSLFYDCEWLKYFWDFWYQACDIVLDSCF